MALIFVCFNNYFAVRCSISGSFLPANSNLNLFLGARFASLAPVQRHYLKSMKHCIATLVINCVLLSALARADEQLPVLKVGSETYSNVTITSISSTDVYFKFDKGVANAKLKKLDPALQTHFRDAAAKAAASEKKAQIAAAQRAATAGLISGSPANQSSAANTEAIDVNQAIARVKAIINQPVTQIAPAPGMNVTTYRPGWFHDGAIKPDFNNVDIRKSQDINYGKHEYVTSDLNPDVVFKGSEVEFNPMTKYFYANRSLPKKKLTEAEMQEINRLYRIIGKNQK
jgi:hypothetical protein